jgi:hypothetical protein
MKSSSTLHGHPLWVWLTLITLASLVACGQQDDAALLIPIDSNANPSTARIAPPASQDAAVVEQISSQASDLLARDLPIAYIKRLLPVDADSMMNVSDLTSPSAFNPGATLHLRARAAANAIELNLSSAVFSDAALVDIKDLEVSTDGQQLLFALRTAELEDDDDGLQPTWDIWLYTLGSAAPRRIIGADINAEAGDDIAPAFLPDGRIVFSSNRQRRSRSLLLDDGKPQYSGLAENEADAAFNLHIMDADGDNITQISFNQSHDLDPTLLDNGRILFLRWDHVANRDKLSFYSLTPNGEELQIEYGYHSQFTGTEDTSATFWQNRLLPDGSILANLRPARGIGLGGDLVRIDINGFSDFSSPTPNVMQAAAANTIDQTAQRSLAPQPVVTNAALSLFGHYHGAYPLFDGTDRLLVSWSQCRLQTLILPRTIVSCDVDRIDDPAYRAAPPLFGLWLLDLQTQTQLPIALPVEGEMVTEVAVMASRPVAQFLPPQIASSDQQQQWVDAGVGLVQIRSVYDIAGMDSSAQGIAQLIDPQQTLASARPARFLRIVKAVSQPNDEVRDISNSAFGVSRGQGMREILGYVPVEPDGSARFLVPADIAFGLSVLDSKGRRISERHNNWLHMNAGSQMVCNGCHTANSETAHGRPNAEPTSINTGAPTSGTPWPNTAPNLIPEMAETMAMTLARIRGTASPSVDVVLHDDWSEVPPADITYAYADLTTAAPVSEACQAQWQAGCRITINYPQHLAPLWSKQRISPNNVDNTCISCHSLVDAAGNPRVPAAQLDLSNTPSATNDEQVTSYRELLSNDQALILDPTGTLITELVQATDNAGNLLFQTDVDGTLVLDSNGDRLPLLVTVNVPRSLSANGALASQRFLTKFDANGSHQDRLTPAELRLIAEWLDIGGQYYNNPFAAPAN